LTLALRLGYCGQDHLEAPLGHVQAVRLGSLLDRSVTPTTMALARNSAPRIGTDIDATDESKSANTGTQHLRFHCTGLMPSVPSTFLSLISS